MKFSIDIGGTFTDLVVEDDAGGVWLKKSPTTPHDPVEGILNALKSAAFSLDMSLGDLLGKGEMLIHATTRALNAVLTGNTAKTAFLTTKGHPDVLLMREGGGRDRFNNVQPYPEPYVPRSLTFEINERIAWDGTVIQQFDEKGAIEVIKRLAEEKVEAVGVCFLWSFANPEHELKMGELLDKYLPGIPYTLSHKLNPTMREYRRASSACIDASLKPIMTDYLHHLQDRLVKEGFNGRLLFVTSNGGLMDASIVADAPIHSLKSGPAMAPVAGRFYGEKDANLDAVIVADTGGTSYDVSLVRKGRIPWSRETWIGPEFHGHMTGFPSIDVESIGAGGGSIAWVDLGGMLHVGPQSAGSMPGPACYKRGGTKPTVTDACMVLGYLDPAYFLGGTMELDFDASWKAVEAIVAKPLGMDVLEAAAAIIKITTENMVQLIEEVSVNQGVDPRTGVLIGGGGAAGLNSTAIARRLGCSKLIIPETGAALSAFGALLSDLTSEYTVTRVIRSNEFDRNEVNQIIVELEKKCEHFIATSGKGSISSKIELFSETRYPSEIWELDVPLRKVPFDSEKDLDVLLNDFHKIHAELFGTSDPGSPIEVLRWRARVSCCLREGQIGIVQDTDKGNTTISKRQIYFPGVGKVEAEVRYIGTMNVGEKIQGPAIIESPVTTVVIDPGATVERTASGNLSIDPGKDVSK